MAQINSTKQTVKTTTPNVENTPTSAPVAKTEVKEVIPTEKPEEKIVTPTPTPEAPKTTEEPKKEEPKKGDMNEIQKNITRGYKDSMTNSITMNLNSIL